MCIRDSPDQLPGRKKHIASDVRSLNGAAPETASQLLPEAPEGCILHHFSRRCDSADDTGRRARQRGFSGWW
eukprot:4581098-Alexandrium_andersonii.AAC.1